MTRKTREAVHAKYNGHCAYCGKEITLSDMQVDHFHPKDKPYLTGEGEWKRAGDEIENLMHSCRRCNHYKRANQLEYFRKLLCDLFKKVTDKYLFKIATDCGMLKWTWSEWDGLFYFERVKEEQP